MSGGAAKTKLYDIPEHSIACGTISVIYFLQHIAYDAYPVIYYLQHIVFDA